MSVGKKYVPGPTCVLADALRRRFNGAAGAQ